MISLTTTAVKEVNHIMKEQEISPEKHFLRVGVKGGGCSGFSYTLDITEAKTDMDEEFVNDGITVLCDSKSMIYLEGTTVDFKDEVMGRGFTFENPNSTSSCGCGSSFSA
jgi:iron-sulfur cluster assembly protein